MSHGAPKRYTRKQFLHLLAGTAAIGAAAAVPSAEREASARIRRAAPKRGRPYNILVIMTDQERTWSSLPDQLSLPARRELQARGVTFTKYQVNALACGPARSVIYTGQHILRTGIFDNPGGPPGHRKDLDPQTAPTIGQLLKDLGYYTAYKGKWHLSQINQPGRTSYLSALRPFGFDEWQTRPDTYGRAGEGATLDRHFTDDAVHWLQTKAHTTASAQPWLLCVNLLNPHDVMFFDATGRQERERLERGRDPRMIGAPGRKPYCEDLGLELPPSFADSLGAKPRAHAAFIEHSDLLYGPIPRTDVAAWLRYQNYYFNCLRDVDTQIARVMQALQESGEAPRTIVVFTSDHGEMGGAHGMRNKGPTIYRENVDVPLVVIHPDLRGGVTTPALASAVDLAPTLLALAGVNANERSEKYPFLAGCDLSVSLEHPEGPGPRAERGGNLLLFSAVHASNPLPYWNLVQRRRDDSAAPGRFPEDDVQFDTRTFYRGIYDGRYRFARYFRPRDHHTPATWEELVARNDLELYDDELDPHSLTNLAAEPQRAKDLIFALNAQLNALLSREAGTDDGSYMPGPPHLWRL